MCEQRHSLLPLLKRHQSALEAFSAFSSIYPENYEDKALLALLAANLRDSFRPIYRETLKLDSSTAKSGVPLGSDLVVDDAR